MVGDGGFCGGNKSLSGGVGGVGSGVGGAGGGGLRKYVTVGFVRGLRCMGLHLGLASLWGDAESRGGRNVREGRGGGGGPRLPRRGQYQMYKAQVFQLGEAGGLSPPGGKWGRVGVLPGAWKVSRRRGETGAKRG